MDLTAELIKLQGQALETMDQKRKFLILEVLDQKITIIVESTGKKRDISIEEIAGPIRFLFENKKITRIEINREMSLRNPAYVISILAKITGAKISKKPISLFLE